MASGSHLTSSSGSDESMNVLKPLPTRRPSLSRSTLRREPCDRGPFSRNTTSSSSVSPKSSSFSEFSRSSSPSNQSLFGAVHGLRSSSISSPGICLWKCGFTGFFGSSWCSTAMASSFTSSATTFLLSLRFFVSFFFGDGIFYNDQLLRIMFF